jgi:hypothetical protein
MTRDAWERLKFFLDRPVDVRRLGLNWDQVQNFGLPPNSTKVTDSRAEAYIRRFGSDSGEANALDSSTMSDLIRVAVEEILDVNAVDQVKSIEERERSLLIEISRRWDAVVEFVGR